MKRRLGFWEFEEGEEFQWYRKWKPFGVGMEGFGFERIDERAARKEIRPHSVEVECKMAF